MNIEKEKQKQKELVEGHYRAYLKALGALENLVQLEASTEEKKKKKEGK